MALAYTVTVLADHKGVTAPKAVGDEYVVDAVIDVTSHVAAGAVIPASQFGLTTIHCATICGTEGGNTRLAGIETSATGGYESSTSIALIFTSLDGTNATVANDGDPTCAVRVRVWGLI
jgi:hypothetical protein